MTARDDYPNLANLELRPPTVDEMLAWLHVNNPNFWDYGGKPGSFFVAWRDTGCNANDLVTGDTLLEALSGAVRAVAGALEARS